MCMSLLIKYYQQRIGGCPINSNYELEGSKEFTSYLNFIDLATQPCSLVGLDESHHDLDARSGTSNSVKFFSHLVFYLRKLKTTMFLTTPTINTLDQRVIKVCQLYCQASKDKEYFYYTFYDLQRGGRLVRRFKVLQSTAFQIASLIYDSDAMITPMAFPVKDDWLPFLENLKETRQTYIKSGQLNADLVALRGGQIGVKRPDFRNIEEELTYEDFSEATTATG